MSPWLIQKQPSVLWCLLRLCSIPILPQLSRSPLKISLYSSLQTDAFPCLRALTHVAPSVWSSLLLFPRQLLNPRMPVSSSRCPFVLHLLRWLCLPSQVVTVGLFFCFIPRQCCECSFTAVLYCFEKGRNYLLYDNSIKVTGKKISMFQNAYCYWVVLQLLGLFMFMCECFACMYLCVLCPCLQPVEARVGYQIL